MKSRFVIVIISLGILFLIYNINFKEPYVENLKVEEGNRFCFKNASNEDGKVFFSCYFSVTNNTRKSIQFRVKIIPKDQELVNLIGSEVKLTKGKESFYNEVFEIGPNINESISGIITTNIPKNELDKITNGFKNFDIVLYK